MQSVTDGVRALVDAYAKITLSVYIDGEKLDVGIGSCALSANCGDDLAFSFGNACAASLDLVLAEAIRDLKMRNIAVTWAVDETEHPLFTGKVEDALISAGRTTVKAWDAMYYEGSDAFRPSDEMLTDVDAATAFIYIANAMGVAVETASLSRLSGIMIPGGFSDIQEDISNSAAAGYVAALIGGNAVINREGFLSARSITATEYETEPYSGGASAKDNDFIISGVTIQRQRVTNGLNEDGTSSEEVITEEYIAGDGTLVVSNPLGSQASAEKAYSALSQLSFRPGSYSVPGGLLLEPGDLFRIHSMDGDYNVAAVCLDMNIDGGATATISCGGKLPAGGAQGTINQLIASIVADYAKLRKLVVDNASINSANIQQLISADIVAERIKAGILQSRDKSGSYFRLNLDTGEIAILSETKDDVGTLGMVLSGGEITLTNDSTTPRNLLMIRGYSDYSQLQLQNSNAVINTIASEDHASMALSVETEDGDVYHLMISVTSDGAEITGLSNPQDASSAANKHYVDGSISDLKKYIAENFAPAGSGLGSGAATIKVVSDCDEAVHNGWYHISVATKNGIGCDAVMRVDAYSKSKAVCQSAYATDVTAYGNAIMQRWCRNGTWEDWEWANCPPLVPGVEYRTTERWKGEAVYRMAVSCGAWSKGSKVTVPVESCSQGVDLYGKTADGGLMLPGSMKTSITNEGIQLTMRQCHANSGATDVVIKYTKS